MTSVSKLIWLSTIAEVHYAITAQHTENGLLYGQRVTRDGVMDRIDEGFPKMLRAEAG